MYVKSIRSAEISKAGRAQDDSASKSMYGSVVL